MRVTSRRAAAVLGLALLSLASAAHDAEQPEVTRLLERADAALAAGQAEDAQAAYEQAAALQHTARIEVGWVRARMQAGGYRQALAFAAHAAGAHPDEADGALLYAHLLMLGGQQPIAQEVLARARQRLPAEPALKADMKGCPSRVHSVAPAHLQPTAFGEPVPEGATVVGGALLLDDAAQAVVPLSLVDGDGPLWVRNGLGRTQRVRVSSRDSQSGTALLQLAAPLDTPTRLWRAPRDAFPGSPAHVAAYPVGNAKQPAWPRLCSGFLGAPSQDGVGRPLGIGVEDGAAGAPVFDGAARLIGLVVPAGPAGTLTLLPARQLPSFQPSADTSAVAVDEVYERALRSSLQLIRLPAGNK